MISAHSRSGEARRVMRVRAKVVVDGALLSLALGGEWYFGKSDIPRIVGAFGGKERLTLRV